jgi:polysaccharide biosynthesis protein PslH
MRHPASDNPALGHGQTGAGPKKKLLYLAVCDPDLEVTGATVRMGAFVKHLSTHYDITLLFMAGSGHQVDPAVEERFRDCENRLGLTGRVRVPFSQLGYFLFSPTLYRKADRLLRFGSFDYLLTDYGLAATYGALFARRYRIPLIYSSHNVEYRLYLDRCRYDLRRAVLVPYVYWAERSACRAAKLVVAISEKDRQTFLRWASDEAITVIPQGFDPEIFNPFYPPPQRSPGVVLFVGNFRSSHNREAARTIVREILTPVIRERPDVKFQFVGANPPAGLEGPNVECAGFVDNLVPYLRRANLMIAPMNVEQGMSTKIVTGLALGKTVLTTPQGAGSIPQKYRQLVISPLDAFPSRIIELLSRPRSVDEADFAILCRDFGWPSLTAALHRRIEECCGSSSGDQR